MREPHTENPPPGEHVLGNLFALSDITLRRIQMFVG